MNKTLKVFTYTEDAEIGKDKLFLEDSPITINHFTYTANRMGSAPVITATIYHEKCLDELWTDKVCVVFNGERYFLAQIPTSSYSNEDARYKHEVTFASERLALEDVFFFDVVADEESDRPVSNSSEVLFYGDVHEFASRLNASLTQSGLDYSIVVDIGVTSEEKLVSLSDSSVMASLQEMFKLFEVPFYFIGKTIHIGYKLDTDDTVFKYGANDALISVSKQNANYKIVNRCTGTGSEENIPYYYPNLTPWGESEIVYNHVAGNGAEVVDWQKIAPYGNTCVIRYGDLDVPSRVVADSWSNLEHESQQSISYDNGWGVLCYEYSYTGTVYFEVGVGYDTLMLNFASDNSNSAVDLEIIVQDVAEEGGKQVFRPNNSNVINIGTGKYKATFKAYIKDIDASYFNFKDLLESEFTFSITISQTSNYNGWVINEKEAVTLDQVGIVSHKTPEVGDEITFSEPVNYINPSTKLMPSIYRESLGKERFYNAVNNVYEIPDSKGTYEFKNLYVKNKPKEHIIHIDDIKPTIKGMTNASGQQIDMFTEFAFDANDNDDFDDAGNYLHPYFYGKLRRFDGPDGFNLFNHAIEKGPMTISMTSGVCGACNFEIGVDEDSQKNVIQVDADGNLVRDENGDVVRRGVPQPQQNDTQENEVWIALKKDINTYGVIMPNAQNKYYPSAGDTFVILNILLPDAYITAAERRLDNEIIKYMFENNDEKFTFSVKLSRIYLAEHTDVRNKLCEDSSVWVEYNDKLYFLYVSSYSFKQTDEALPEITIELTDTLATGSNTLQRIVGEVNDKISQAAAAVQIEAAHRFVSKIEDDAIQGNIAFHKQTTFGASAKSSDYKSDALSGRGWAITKDPNGDSLFEIDRLRVRKELHVNELVINQSRFSKGDIIYSNGGCEVSNVEEFADFFRCHYDNKGGESVSGFAVGDQALCQRYSPNYHNIIAYYWRLVVGVGATYVDLSKTDYDGMDLDDPSGEGAAKPSIGDDLCQLGNRTDKNRQSAIVISPANGGKVVVYNNIDSYSLADKNYVGYGVNPETNRAFLYGYGDMFFGDRKLESDFITFQTREGETKPKLIVNATVEFGSDSTGLSNLSDYKNLEDAIEKTQTSLNEYIDGLGNLQDQIDGVVESYFYDYDPTTENYPASDWTTDEEKEYNLNDTFTNLQSGRSWRWSRDNGQYLWVEITDTATVEALRLAGEAKDTADGKRRVFTETPTNADIYDVGDLWVNATYGNVYSNDILRCKTSKSAGQVFSIAHWELASKYTDDTVANEALNTANSALETAKRAVTLVDVFYALSASATTYPPKTDTDAWDTTPPTWVDGEYIWSYTKTIYANGTYAETDPVNITGAIGATGVGISQIVEQYAITDSPTVLPSESAWSTNRPEWVNGKYIWTRSVIYYTDSREPYTTQPICVTGERGHDGTDAENNYVLDLSNQMATVACDAQGNVIGTLPTTTAKVYYGTQLERNWTFTIQEEGCDATITQDSTSATISIVSLSSNDAQVQIAATKDDKPILNVTFSVSKVLQGLKGDRGEQGIQGIQGIQGERGEQGIQGEKGETGTNGETSYFHVKFADDAQGTNMNEVGGDYIGTYVDFVQQDSANPNDYTWVKTKGAQGEQGEQGIAGKNGENGQTSYLHIAYADSSNGYVGFSTSDSTNKLYIGQYTDFIEDDSEEPRDYSWTKIKGEQGAQGDKGEDGRGIVSTTISYGVSDSATSEPTSWSSTIPSVAEGKYLWTRTVIDYTSGDDSVSYTYAKQGAKGEAGKSGTSVTVTSIQYQAGTSPTTPPTGTWSNNVVSVAEGQYLWTKTTFSDGNVAYGVAKQGEKGDTGAAAVIYSIEPSVDKVTRDRDVITPNVITVTQYKTTGNTARTITAEKTIKYQRNGKDGSIQSAGNVATYTIAIDSKSITSVDIYLYDGNTLLDKERVPVLADANALDELSGQLEGFGADLEEVKAQTDKEYTIWFADSDYVPTNSNAPASDWTTQELKEMHEEDIFYNSFSGLAWRYESGNWESITDAQTVEALEKAMEAKELASELSSGQENDKQALAESMGYSSYAAMIASFTSGLKDKNQTLILDGYINTGLIEADKISAGAVVVTEFEGGNVGKISNQVSVTPTDMFTVTGKVDVEGNTEYGRLKMQANSDGLTFYKTVLNSSNNPEDTTSAIYSGKEVGSIDELIPDVFNTAVLYEAKWNNASGTELLLTYQNNTGREMTAIIPALCIAIQAQSQSSAGQTNRPTGGLSVVLSGAINKTISINLSDISWETYEPFAGTILYRGYFEFQYPQPATSVKVAAGSTLRLSATTTLSSISGANVKTAVRIGSQGNADSDIKTTTIPISTSGDTNLSLSNYYGNGFLLAKSIDQYIAGIVSESAGATFQIRNGSSMMRFTSNGLEVSDNQGQTWRKL